MNTNSSNIIYLELPLKYLHILVDTLSRRLPVSKSSPFFAEMTERCPSQHLVERHWQVLVGPQSEVCCALWGAGADERPRVDHCPLLFPLRSNPGSWLPLHQLHRQMERWLAWKTFFCRERKTPWTEKGCQQRNKAPLLLD